MSDILFPATLPPPLKSGYAADATPITMSMETDAGTQRVRAKYRSAPTAHTLTWRFTQAQYDVFDSFYEHDLAAGSRSFLCPLDDGKGGLDAALVFFVEPPSEEVDDGMNWRVNAKVLTAGVAFGKFPRLINVDGASGAEEPGPTGGGGVQNPVREIHFEPARSLRVTGTGLAHVVIASNGRLVLVDAAGVIQPAGEWKSVANTTPTSEYSYAYTLTVLDWRDGSGVVGNDPDSWSVPPTSYNTDPQALSVYRLDAAVNSITSNLQTSLRASFYHPWIKYLLTIKVKDPVSGYQASCAITIELGNKPAGRELG